MISRRREREQARQNWKTQTYVIGTLLGTVLGFLSAYLYAKEADEYLSEDEKPEIPASAMLGLALSVLSVVRKIAESGQKK